MQELERENDELEEGLDQIFDIVAPKDGARMMTTILTEMTTRAKTDAGWQTMAVAPGNRRTEGDYRGAGLRLTRLVPLGGQDRS